jgi:hypothetical protein
LRGDHSRANGSANRNGGEFKVRKYKWGWGIVAFAWLCGARAQDMDLQAVVRDTQIMRQNGNSMDLVWWMPIEFWRGSFAKSPGISAKQLDELVGTIDDYIILSVLESTVGTLGVMASTPKDELEKKDCARRWRQRVAPIARNADERRRC